MDSKSDKLMIFKFCCYTTFRNLRFYEPFLVLYLYLSLDMSFVVIGAILAYEKILVGFLESPLGAFTDRWGRCRGVIGMYLLAGMAFSIYAASSLSVLPLLWIVVAQTLMAFSEALRSGTHKAIMLDWLDSKGQRDRASEVIGLTRIFSKVSTGVGAIVGGIFVWAFASFVPLFLISLIPCVIGALIMWTYPKELEGEWSREDKQGAGKNWWIRFKSIFSAQGIVVLLGASVIFETVIKLAMIYLQPYLAEGVGQYQLEVIGGLGAIVIGLYYLIQGLIAGFCSTLGIALEKIIGSAEWTLHIIYFSTILCLTATVIGLWFDTLWPGMITLGLLVCLQNARRPLFLAKLNDYMDPYQRGTTLSIESQFRSWLYAALAIGTGVLQDTGDLFYVFLVLTALIVIGYIIRSSLSFTSLV